MECYVILQTMYRCRNFIAKKWTDHLPVLVYCWKKALIILLNRQMKGKCWGSWYGNVTGIDKIRPRYYYKGWAIISHWKECSYSNNIALDFRTADSTEQNKTTNNIIFTRVDKVNNVISRIESTWMSRVLDFIIPLLRMTQLNASIISKKHDTPRFLNCTKIVFLDQ